MLKADGFLLQDTKNLNYTHTGRHIEKQWRLLLFHSTEKKNCCDIAFNHWAETNIHTVPLKWWLAQRSCKAWGRLGHVHTHTHVLTWAAAHAHTSSFTSAILHIYGCSCSNRITAPPLRCIQSERRGVKGHPQIRLPCFCLSSQANSGTRGDITQRPQPYVSVVHRRSNMTPRQ